MKGRTLIALVLFGISSMMYAREYAVDSAKIIVRKTADFKVSGDGSANVWATTGWVTLTVQESSGHPLSTRAKILYSDLGIYFLFECEDRKLTATKEKDFDTLFKEDVVEVFLWPDQSVPIYFEYELSPLNYELPILVPNLNGKIQGWSPWPYHGDRKTQHATSVQGGEKKSHATIKSWMAEFFIPFKLLSPLVGKAPKPGDQWRANLYRIDYDDGYTTWTWQKTTHGADGNFHEFNKFGTLEFE